MKRSFLFTLLFAGLSFNLSAQEADTAETEEPDDSTEVITTSISRPLHYDNIVKINATSLIVKNISLQYERILNKKMSLALGLRFMPKTSLPFRGSIENAIDEEDVETLKFIHEARTGGFAITPEFRYYLGAGYGKGFYLAPFVRYERFNIESIYPFTDENDVPRDLDFKGHNSTVGIGLMVGSQFRLSDRLTLDWWILGPYYTSNSIKLTASGFSLSDEGTEMLREDLEDIEIAWLKAKATVENTSAELKASGSFAAVRGFGLCLGFKF